MTYAALVEAAEARLGLKLQRELRRVIEKTAAALVKDGQARGLDEVLRRLVSAPDDDACVARIRQSVSIGETWFLRGRAQLELLVQHVAARRPKRLSVWSAACASGEEAYSVALLLHRALPRCELSVLGTDMNPHSLEVARQGVYGARSFREVPAQQLLDGLSVCGHRFEVRPPLRMCVAFVPLNLAVDEYPSRALPLSGFDVILCRNVLMYLAPVHVPAVLRKLMACGAPNMVLALTPTEFAAGAAVSGLEHVGRSLFVRRTPKPPANTVARPAAARAPALPHGAPVEPRPPVDQLLEAREAADAGQWLRAREMLAAVLAVQPDLAFAHLLSAEVNLAQGEVEAAISHARRAVYLDRKLAAAELQLGLALLKRPRAASARAHLKRALALLDGLPDGEQAPGLFVSVAMARSIIADALGRGP